MMKTDRTTRETIRRWAAEGCPRQDGIRIMRTRHPNRVTGMSAHLMTESKLRYELLKLYGIPPEKLWNNSRPALQTINEHEKEGNTRKGTGGAPRPQAAAQGAPGKGAAAAGNPLVQAKALAKDLSGRITDLHEDAFAAGTANDEASVRRRRKANDEKARLIRKREELYKAREKAYATGRKEEVAALVKTAGREKAGDGRPEPGSLSDSELLKAYHNTTTAIRRRLNLLEYSQKTRASEPNPMPKGTRRTRTERELKELKAYRESLGAEIRRREL